MIRYVLSLLIVVVFINQSIAQENQTSQNKIDFDYGVKFGLQVSDLMSGNNELNPRASFQFGFAAEFFLLELVDLQPELIYGRQGQVVRSTTDGGLHKEEILALDYLHLPLMVNYHLSESFFVELGPQISYLLGATYETKLENSSQSNSIKTNYKNFDFGINAGIGFKTDWGFVFGIRYTQGLNNILSNQTQEVSSLRNAVIQMHFGYMF
ncbi:MAG: porin family protein [Bacteroidota bacterium]